MRPPGLQQVISRNLLVLRYEKIITGKADVDFPDPAVALECGIYPSVAWSATGGGLSPVGTAEYWWAARGLVTPFSLSAHSLQLRFVSQPWNTVPRLCPI